MRKRKIRLRTALIATTAGILIGSFTVSAASPEADIAEVYEEAVDSYEPVITEVYEEGAGAVKTRLTMEQARAKALQKTKLTGRNVNWIKQEADDDDYEFEFSYGDYRYDVEVKAYSGKVKVKKYKIYNEKISVDQARKTALKKAQLSETQNISWLVNGELDHDKKGVPEREFEFTWGVYKYEVEVNTYNGKVKSYKRKNVGGKVKDIGESKAKAAALKHFGLSGKKVNYIKVEKDFDDRVLEYEIEFTYLGHKYEIDINASTGGVIKAEIDDIYYNGNTPSPNPNPNPAPNPGHNSNTNGNNDTATITADRAKQIAATHAGIPLSSIGWIKAELDHDDGRLVYEVEFEYGGYEYDFEIDAISGNIIKFDKEYDD